MRVRLMLIPVFVLLLVAGVVVLANPSPSEVPVTATASGQAVEATLTTAPPSDGADKVIQVRRRADVARWYHNAARAEAERLRAEEAARQAAAARKAAQERASAQRAAAPPQKPPVTPGACSGHLAAVQARWPANQVSRACQIIACESGGNPTAQNPHSTASGIWQILDSTWSGYGGYSRAMYAPASVQHDKALALWQSSGWRPWVC